MKNILTTFFFYCAFCSVAMLHAQSLQDDFTDGDFTNNPTWIGNTAAFEVNAGNELRLNTSGAGTSYLSTTASIQDSTTWEFYLRLTFSPSGSNNARVYLQSDNSDLTTNLNGYYLQIGESGSNDALEVFRQDGGSSTSVMRGTDGNVASSPDLRVRITRDNAGAWTMEVDYTGGTTYVLDASGNDNIHTSGGFFGVFCDYTTTNSDKFYFDDILVSPLFVDTNPPVVVSAIATNASNVDVDFDEFLDQTTAEIAGNYVLDNGATVSNATLDGVDPSLVHLTVTGLTNLTTYQLTVNGVEDLSSNPVSNGTASFTYYLTQAAVPGDIVINEIFADPSPTVGLPSTEFVELYNRANYAIDLTGYIFHDGVDRNIPSYTILPNSYVILCASGAITDYQPYGQVLDIGTISLTNGGEDLYLQDATAVVIDSVDYDDAWYQDAVKDDGGWTLELINPNLIPCSGAFNWIASTDVSGGTPGAANSVLDNTPDTQGPVLQTVEFTSSTELILVFDELVDQATAENTGNYSIVGFTVTNAVYAAPDTVFLTLNTAMVNQTNYTLNVGNGLEDCLGNTSTPLGFPFTYFELQPAAFGDIIINEIFADESPQVGLPLVEYVELYNRSTNAIDLENYIFHEGSDRTLPAFVLEPDSFVLVTATANVDSLLVYGDVIGISSMGLTNGGEDLTLKTDFGVLVDSVNYDDAWYQDVLKDDGGWSLEVINPNQTCIGAANWIASIDASGGTPGRQNSVYDGTLDTQGPIPIEAQFLAVDTFYVVFDDVMDAASASNPSNYTVSNGLTVNSVTFTSPSTVTLAVTPNMTDQTQYTVTFNANIQDCVGNPIVVNTINFTYYDIVAATTGDLIFNEIFADPTPSNGLPEGEYVEIFNRSNKTVDLENYRFEDGQVHTLPRLILPSNSYAILCTATEDTAFLAYTPNVIGISGIGLTNGGETLKLRNASGLILDSLRYDDAWYQDNSKDDGGWSLELKNPDHACKGESNWSASIATIGGTPGAINSIYDNTPDTDLPTITGAQQINANQVRLTFSEVMDIAVMTTVGNYSINNGLSFLSATAQGNNSVILTVDNSFTNNTTYTINANNASDCVGNSTNLSIDFTYYDTELAEHYDIIINEIFPDSDPQIGLPEKEYIELYNRSNKVINLQGYTISDGSSAVGTLPFFILQPNNYVILHKDDAVYEYAPYGDYLTSAVFPDLNISGDDLVLRSAANAVIDAVSYDPDWFQNGDKDNGGWSLERINPNRPCEGSSNWRASEDNLGGTPGRVNSILQSEADTDAPDVIRAYPFANNQVRLFFSEAMGDLTAIDASNYDLDNNRVVVSASLEAPFYNTVVITIDTDLEVGIIYTLNMSVGLTDCVGNAIGVNRTVQFALPEDIQVGDVILNEILFNPVTGGSDFIELYNNSDKVVNIADIILANTDDNGLVNQTDNVETDWLLFPQQYVVLSEDPNQVKETYVTENPNNFVENDLPTYGDNDGTVIIYNIIDSIIGTDTIPSDQILDQFVYLDDYHTPLIDDDNGVSLERIDFNAPTQDENNWHSAATAVGYATPAYQNSSFQDNVITDEDLIQIPDKSFSPDGDGFEDFLLINYNVEDIGYVANVTIYDANGRPIRALVNGELLMREGTFQWDGADNAGNKAKVGVYIILLEIFNPAGDVQRMKKTCVVAGAF